MLIQQETSDQINQFELDVKFVRTLFRLMLGLLFGPMLGLSAGSVWAHEVSELVPTLAFVERNYFSLVCFELRHSKNGRQKIMENYLKDSIELGGLGGI